MQSDQDDQDQKITIKIKKFLTKDSGFRNSQFDPAPFIIHVLKQKQADHDAILQRQNQLIEMENQAQQLIQDVCHKYSKQFDKLLKVPQQYGRQLQRLKSNISVVKKKAKQTKNYLNQTQKDIQKIHLNCIFNKIIYKRLKEIQLKLHQFQAASLALKNNRFMACSMHLQHLRHSNSILQNTLSEKAQILSLRLLSRAIQQINIFAYFTPKAILPSTNILLQRPNQQNQTTILNWNQHQGFYKRYHLFKKAYCEDYLRQIWKFDDLQRKAGKIGFIYDVIKGIINQCKIQEVSDTLQLDCKKSIENIFLLLKFFLIKEPQQKQEKPVWFFSCSSQIQKTFISAVLCICGAVLRKLIIIRKIYKQFDVSTLKFNSGTSIKQLLHILYFPSMKLQSDYKQEQIAFQHVPKQIKQKIIMQSSFIYFGFTSGMIKKGLLTLIQSLIYIQQSEFQRDCSAQINQNSLNFLQDLNQLFFKQFHKEFHRTVEQMFQLEGRPFTIEPFQSIVAQRSFSEQQTNFADGYKTDQKKAIKQYIYVVSFLRELQRFFNSNSLSEYKYHRYCLFVLAFFYLKLNSHICKHAIQDDQWAKIQEVRKRDKKLKIKQTAFFHIYYKLGLQTSEAKQKSQKKNSAEKGQFADFKIVEKLKVFKVQNQMLLSFSCSHFQFIEDFRKHQSISEYSANIEKLEAGSYDDNIQAKFIRIWDKLPQSETAVKVAIAAVFQKIINLHLSICAKIYIETGNC